MYSVYIHINKVNQKRYVGITSLPVEIRWKNGFGYSENLPIGRAIRKYGWDNFEHEVMYDDLDTDTAKLIECLLIELLETQNPEYGYNISAGGDGIRGYHFSEETKKRMSDAAKALNRTGENNPNYGNKWTDEMKVHLSDVLKARNATTETHKARSDAAKKRVGDKNSFYGKTHSDETKELMSKLKRRPVKQYDKDGVLIREYDSIKSAAEKTGINKVAISNCCRGMTKTSGSFKWKYSDED